MAEPLARLAAALASHYRLERELGQGGMATVYLAQDLKHDRQVALKVLRPELAAAMGSDRFPREIKFVAQLNHPHILSLYDSGEAQGFLFYVMPYIEGESLRDRLSRERQLPVADAIRILHEVADALSYAHARGVVHRDIKPANVMLSGRHAMVTDFGVAKALTAAGGDTMTTVGIAVGTPNYMAPEQAMGVAEIDHRVDIYALGVLAYEMLAGRPVFDTTSPQALLKAHVMDTPVDLREHRPAIPPVLADLVMRCLAKEPADRWHSADDIVTRLEAIAATPSGGMTPTDTRPYTATTARRGPRRALVAAVVSVVVIAAAAGVWALRGGAAAGIEKIGVLPIEDISGQDSVFVSSLHDLITNALARLDLAGVAPRSAMMRYRGDGRTTRDIARENQLNAVIEATVFRAGEVMRINVQFTDPTTSRALWSDTYERNVSDVMAAQNDVVERIAAGVAGALVPARNNGEMR